jgi:hypothetical protein
MFTVPEVEIIAGFVGKRQHAIVNPRKSTGYAGANLKGSAVPARADWAGFTIACLRRADRL